MTYITLQITKTCSAACSHCEFTRAPSEPSLHEVSRVLDEASKLSAHVIVTGGEPFESLNLQKIIQEIDRRNLMYRIATGGHISLDSYAATLRKSSWLSGIQIGTDVLLAERGDGAFERVWHANLRLLAINAIPISLTFTASPDVDASPILSILRHANPSSIRISRISLSDEYTNMKCARLVAQAARSRGMEVVYDDSL